MYMTVSADFAVFFERRFLQTDPIKLSLGKKHPTYVGVLILVTSIIDNNR